jgi:hypothetical protein
MLDRYKLQVTFIVLCKGEGEFSQASTLMFSSCSNTCCAILRGHQLISNLMARKWEKDLKCLRRNCGTHVCANDLNLVCSIQTKTHKPPGRARPQCWQEEIVTSNQTLERNTCTLLLNLLLLNKYRTLTLPGVPYSN